LVEAVLVGCVASVLIWGGEALSYTDKASPHLGYGLVSCGKKILNGSRPLFGVVVADGVALGVDVAVALAV
jgi:hypothetical protein